MKKILLAIAAVLVGMSVSANPFTIAGKMKLNPGAHPDIHLMDITEPITVTENALISRADASEEEVYYTLAERVANSLGFNNAQPGMQVAMACQIDPTFLANLSDAQITSITFYTGSDSKTKRNEIKKGWVFITDNLSGEFLYTQEVDLPGTQYTRVDVKLTTPFVIPANKKIYIGVYETVTAPTNTPLVIDYTAHSNDLGGWAAYRTSESGKWSWNNIAEGYGFFTVGATIKAKGFLQNSVAVVAVAGPPVATENSSFEVEFMLLSNGIQPVTNFTYEASIDDEVLDTRRMAIDGDWKMNQTIICPATLKPSKPSKDANVLIKITKVNDEDNVGQDMSGTYPIVIVPQGKGLKRNVVVEEFTCTKCQYCPTGYTAMEKIHEDYTDGSIIPVCVHGDRFGTDPMTAASFSSLYKKYTNQEGNPYAAVNRQYGMYPSYDAFVAYAELIQTLPGIAKVSAKAKINKETRMLTIDTETQFAFDYTDGDQNFILAFAVTEDGVGPYAQKNGYAGMQGTVPGDWNKQPAEVKLVYNDVARQLDKYAGITGSVPAEIKAGEICKYTHEMKLLSTISDFDKIHVIVYVLNLKDGTIENAYTIASDGNGNYAGIEPVIVDNDEEAPVEYYNLQGVRVNNPSTGVFIRRQGNKVSKVLVR
ncbi:MAG: Omp28-related outer membrane protein [Muribaculaceae bacterium]|nr:Omp28-related outer membrane protein [Muribaculaceae bacterium]